MNVILPKKHNTMTDEMRKALEMIYRTKGARRKHSNLPRAHANRLKAYAKAFDLNEFMEYLTKGVKHPQGAWTSSQQKV